MKIKYYLVENLMTPDPEDCRAQITGYESVTEKEIIEYMTRSGSTITAAEAKANYEEFISTYEYFLRQGYGINTEFINILPVIQGVFENKDAKFDPAKHRIKFKVHLGKRYNHTSSEVKTEKVEPVNNAPLPTKFEDVASGTVNEIITNGGTAVLSGFRMKFDQNDGTQGIFLISSQQNEFRIDRILIHNSTKIVFILPDGMPSDLYTLEVRVLPKGNREIKKGTLAETLTV
jgi:hypothetical protein